MKFKDFVKQQQDLLEKYPETADWEVMQTSCMDNPYRYETLRIFMGEVYSVADEDGVLDYYADDDSAQERVEDEEERGNDDSRVLPWENVVVIEAI